MKFIERHKKLKAVYHIRIKMARPMNRIPFFIQPRNNIQKQASLKQKLNGTDTVFPLECSAFLFSVKVIVSIK